jgi:hypothetical protein
MTTWNRLALGLLLLCVFSQAQAAPEYRIKAAILYNLMRMVEWPNEGVQTAGKPLQICFIGEEPFGDALDLIRAKQVRNRPLEFTKNIALGQAEQCDLLFISASEHERLNEIIQAVHQLPLLTVSDSEGFAERGVVINLMKEEKKIRMELNATVAESAQLAISPTLKKLAVKVENAFEAAAEVADESSE